MRRRSYSATNAMNADRQAIGVRHVGGRVGRADGDRKCLDCGLNVTSERDETCLSFGVVPFGECLGLFMKKLALAVFRSRGQRNGRIRCRHGCEAPRYQAPKQPLRLGQAFMLEPRSAASRPTPLDDYVDCRWFAPGFVIPPPTVDGSSPRRFSPSSGRFGVFAGYDYQFRASVGCRHCPRCRLF